MSNASADNAPSLRAELQPSTVKLGDLITLHVQTTHAPGISVELPAFQKELGTFEVYASTALPAQVSGAQETQQFQIELQNFTTGQQTLPGMGFSYRGTDNQIHLLKTPEFKVTVETVPPGPKDKAGDIREIIGVLGPTALSPLWWMLLAAVVLGAGFWFWKKRQRIIEGPLPPPPIPADELALKKLQELLTSGYVESGKLKEFYSGISDSVRAYVEQGFHCAALERTTGELMRDLRKRTLFASDALVLLKELLEECDLVKFAKFRPEADESLKTHAEAVRFIEKTKNALKPNNG